MSPVTHSVYRDVDELSRAAAAAAADVIAETRADFGRPARISLTGGGAGLATARRLAECDIDWRGVHIHLGDERFVPRDHAERNSGQIDEALLRHIDGHEFVDWPAPGDPGAETVVQAAHTFAVTHPLPPGGDTYFDLVLLGMGGEGHVNSVFPYTAQVADDAEPIMAVDDSPKPPPERLTYTLPVVRRSRQVFLLVAGAEKAEAVAAVASGAAAVDWPAAGATGVQATRWFLDPAAASRLSL